MDLGQSHRSGFRTQAFKETEPTALEYFQEDAHSLAMNYFVSYCLYIWRHILICPWFSCTACSHGASRQLEYCQGIYSATNSNMKNLRISSENRFSLDKAKLSHCTGHFRFKHTCDSQISELITSEIKNLIGFLKKWASILTLRNDFAPVFGNLFYKGVDSLNKGRQSCNHAYASLIEKQQTKSTEPLKFCYDIHMKYIYFLRSKCIEHYN